jgi:DNA-directed RNA polymerase subunit H (RpoH/RPB5)
MATKRGPKLEPKEINKYKVVVDKLPEKPQAQVFEEPNETIINKVKYLYEHSGIFVVIHNIKRLQFNILEHVLNPSVQILTQKEVDELKIKLNLKDIKLLPEISRFDPLALAINMRPGEVAKFIRNSVTALNAPYYRICV